MPERPCNDRKGRAPSLGLEMLEARLVPSGVPLLQQSFDGTPIGALPSGWSQWSSNGSAAFAVSSAQPLSGPNGLASSAASNVSARAWAATAEPADVQATADVFVNDLTPAQVLARGSNLNTTTPTYYALSVTRGMSLTLLRRRQRRDDLARPGEYRGLVHGKLGAADPVDHRQPGAGPGYRPDTGQYLNASGQWQSARLTRSASRTPPSPAAATRGSPGPPATPTRSRSIRLR